MADDSVTPASAGNAGADVGAVGGSSPRAGNGGASSGAGGDVARAGVGALGGDTSSTGGFVGSAGGSGELPNTPDDCVPEPELADPTTPGEHAVGHSKYSGASIRLGADHYVVSVAADVFYPASESGADATVAAGGPFPVVVIMHGMHSVFRLPSRPIYCAETAVWNGPSPHVKSLEEMRQTYPNAESVPNNLGYAYLGQSLASAGYVLITIDANTTNCLPYANGLGFIPERGELMREHLKRLASKEVTGIAHLDGKLDFSRVVLAGHSRGGEGAILAAAAGPLPGITLRGVMAVAPTAWLMESQYSEKEPLQLNTPLLMLLSAADGDQSESGGMRYYDVTKPQSPSPGWFKAQQFVHGANHNFYNSEWNDASQSCDRAQPDGDNGVGHGSDRLTRVAQEHYLVAITHTFLEATLAASRTAREVLAGNARSRAFGDVVVAASFQDSLGASQPSASMAIGGGQLSAFPFSQSAGAYNSSFFHETSGYVASWQGLPVAFGFSANYATTRPRFVTFRVAQVADPKNPTNRFARLDVDLLDAAGRKLTGRSDWAGATIAPYYERPPEPDPYQECKLTSYEKTVLGTVRIPLACFEGDAAFDASSVRSIEVRPRDTQGVLALTDFELMP
jgi:dienelactone hydrolase